MGDPVSRAITSTNRSPAKAKWHHRSQVVKQNAHVSGGADSEISNISQEQIVNLQVPFPVFFDLRVFQELQDSESLSPFWEPMNLPIKLAAGQHYQIRVTTSPNRAMSQGTVQHPVMVTQAMDVYLQTSQSISATTLSDVKGVVKPEEIEQFEHDFLLTIHPECPIVSLFLN